MVETKLKYTKETRHRKRNPRAEQTGPDLDLLAKLNAIGCLRRLGYLPVPPEVAARLGAKA